MTCLKRYICGLVMSMTSTSLTAPVQAEEAKQTVEGAQTFLSLMAEQKAFTLTVSVKGEGDGSYNKLTSDQSWYSDKNKTRLTNRVTWERHRQYGIDFFKDFRIARDSSSTCKSIVTIHGSFFFAEDDPSFGIQKQSPVQRQYDGFFNSSFGTLKFPDPESVFGGPHLIDWSKVTVARLKFSPADVIKFDQVGGPSFALFPASGEDSDRLEYAAKFLKMSCDRAAATGF